ncbi:MAG: UDP-N-acetylmuramoyl-L-alanyl-D-glutamate--2,6-diaminopimelate ligase [Armatimonadota bacterium]|nr:UDP-N-acetylmuramoyl-L-alanyl-D-glutamate--2,6-diaminopimelate ligase [Armatimonadota bacterium]
MRLRDLLEGIPAVVEGSLEVEVEGIASHSQAVRPGFLFAAIRGSRHDGHAFIPEAVANGATAVLVDHRVEGFPRLTQVITPDTRLALGLLSAAFYGHPSRRLHLIGVTGTNGKGTTALMIQAILTQAGVKAGSIGTLGARLEEEHLPLQFTTPEAIELQRLLQLMADRGITHVAMEVASHALALHRVAGCRFEAAVFTNLTRDHLDFHGDFANYLGAKARLFEMVEPQGISVINADDPHSHVLVAKSRAPVLTYGIESPADVRAEEISLTPGGSNFTVCTPSGRCSVSLPMIGRFNVLNALAAIGVANSLGIPLEVAKEALERMPSIPGRFERVDNGGEIMVVVDYAHTPDSLANVLRAAAEITSGRKIVVFGCGGDRDRTKRPIMGRLAVELSEYAIVTSDNPRSEDPMAIIEEIVAGIPDGAGSHYEVEVDRRKAIERAISMARPGDIVIIAGKGHEAYQEIKGVRYPFDDRVVAREALQKIVTK